MAQFGRISFGSAQPIQKEADTSKNGELSREELSAYTPEGTNQAGLKATQQVMPDQFESLAGSGDNATLSKDELIQNAERFTLKINWARSNVDGSTTIEYSDGSQRREFKKDEYGEPRYIEVVSDGNVYAYGINYEEFLALEAQGNQKFNVPEEQFIELDTPSAVPQPEDGPVYQLDASSRPLQTTPQNQAASPSNPVRQKRQMFQSNFIRVPLPPPAPNHTPTQTS